MARAATSSDVTEADADAELAAIIDGSPDAFISTRLDGVITSWNHGAELLYGYTAEEMVGENIGRIYPDAVRESAVAILRRVTLGERTDPIESFRRRKDGSLVEVEVRVSPVVVGGHVIGTSGFARDISARRRRERALLDSTLFLERTQELAHIGSWSCETGNDAVAYWSTELYRIFEIEQGQLVTLRDFFAAVHPDDRELVTATGRSVLTSQRRADIEFRIIRPGGAVRWVFGATDVQLDAQGLPIGWRGVLRDITEERNAAARLARDALYDPLTGLPNGALLRDRIARALARGHERHSRVAVLLADIDRFKNLNDSAGHDLGDAVLQAVTARLASVAGPAQTVGRLESDSVVVVCEGILRDADATDRATSTLGAFEKPFEVDGRSVHVTASIGVAVSRRDSTVDALIRDADLAMYRVKERGRNRYELYDLDLRQRAEQRAALDAGLWQAIERGELFLEFQPIASIEEGRFVGAEALLRWQHPERGRIGPDDFIALAEETGVIGSIGAWALEQACRELKRWRDTSPGSPDWTISVNISTPQLENEDFPRSVKRAVAAAEIDPSSLRLEITESVLLVPGLAREVLPRIREQGVGLSIDDFGTGYSSLAYLMDVAVDEIKIDKVFIDRLLDEHSSIPIVSAIVSIGRSLGLRVTAEGISDKAQLRRLRELGCDAAQGFYLSPPLSGPECLAILVAPPSRLQG